MRPITSIVLGAVLFCGLATVSGACAEGGEENADANAQAKLFWGKVLSKCGDSYLAAIAKRDKVYKVFEYRRVSFEVASVPVTEAATLNGVSWRGIFALSAKVHRSRESKGGWGKWSDGGGISRIKNGDLAAYVDVKKEKGKWIRMGGAMGMHAISSQEFALKKPSCDSLK